MTKPSSSAVQFIGPHVVQIAAKDNFWIGRGYRLIICVNTNKMCVHFASVFEYGMWTACRCLFLSSSNPESNQTVGRKVHSYLYLRDTKAVLRHTLHINIFGLIIANRSLTSNFILLLLLFYSGYFRELEQRWAKWSQWWWLWCNRSLVEMGWRQLLWKE